ncbi:MULTISPECIES: TRAP transporter substrate-binding protein [Methylobacterium]|jgi:TRAP-type mannitol/chloroaromatic compound transport system substrate-binding protein|uniref:Alpha-keto acid-binding periplasmic protein TakP n=1 Tax=Methylobacterium isbiliense TaxID=315478 RepID=A0ABQ4S6I6_9HYPH|nr:MULTISPECIES: TRAP transporter substrate-binding protein [Methylobacterium]MBY0299000.1 TRAP transporter substrate-binding protein [Methylobacterium sp.]MDN3625498.1 TRAP transporter substrate-binding protein [Methylobacterium isbiliense]GJD98696.1 Alpha-keto acid-binding periplasmic protein TakP [Methylobacterium isbiliense]
MKRRDVLTAGLTGAGLAGAGLVTTLAAPAVAQTAPELRWRLHSAFPRSLDALYGAAEMFARLVGEASDGRFQIEVAPAPGGESAALLDGVANGTVEMAYSAAYYETGRDPTFALATAAPFGLNARQQNAWMLQGGALDLFNEVFARQKLYALPGGNTGTQMGGWFRREVKGVADLQGLRFRIAGLGAQVLAKLGVVPQGQAGPDLYAALEAKTLDAAEWIGPYDDEKLGLNKVAPFYYYPGFWEGGAMLHFWFNAQKWGELPKPYRAIAQGAAAQVNGDLQAKYDARNPGALRRLVGGGAQLKPFPQEIMEAALKAANEIYADLSAKNPDFKRAYDSLKSFRNEEYLWFQVAEYTYDNFMIRARARG